MHILNADSVKRNAFFHPDHSLAGEEGGKDTGMALYLSCVAVTR